MEIKTNKTTKHLTLLTLCTLALLQPGLAGAMEKNETVALINNFDKKIDDRLLAAAEKGDIKGVKDAIKDGAAIDAKDNDLLTPLHCAASNGHLEIAKFLIEKGATIDAKDSDLWTPLHRASFDGHLEVIKLLIEKGATIDARDKRNETPLYFASLLCAPQEVVAHLTLAQDFLKAAKNPDKFDTFANTYLNLNETKKVEQNLTDIIGIIAPRLNELNPKSLTLFYDWIKKNTKLGTYIAEQKHQEEQQEAFDLKSFCLARARENLSNFQHIALGIVGIGLELTEALPSSAFNKALHELIKKGLDKNIANIKDKDEVKAKKQMLYKQWDALNKQLNKMSDQNKLLASTTYTKKLIIPKKLPTVAVFAANQIVTKPSENFTDVDFGFEN